MGQPQNTAIYIGPCIVLGVCYDTLELDVCFIIGKGAGKGHTCPQAHVPCCMNMNTHA